MKKRMLFLVIFGVVLSTLFFAKIDKAYAARKIGGGSSSDTSSADSSDVESNNTVPSSNNMVLCNYTIISSGIIPNNLETYNTMSVCTDPTQLHAAGICAMSANLSNMKQGHVWEDDAFVTNGFNNHDILNFNWYSIYSPWNINVEIGSQGTSFMLDYDIDKYNMDHFLIPAKENVSGFNCGVDIECPEYLEKNGNLLHAAGFRVTSDYECPKYIIVKNVDESFAKEWWNNFLDNVAEEYDKTGDYLYLNINGFELSKRIATKKTNPYVDLDTFKTIYKHFEQAKIDLDAENQEYALEVISSMNDMKFYTPTNDDEVFREYLKNGTVSEGYYVLPLISFKAGKGKLSEEDIELNNKKVLNSLTVYSDVIINAWNNKINSLLSDVKSNCSNEKNVWDDYINAKNYNGDLSYFLQDYPGESGVENFDKGINQQCWNSRKNLASIYKESFSQFLKNIGFRESGTINEWNPSKGVGNPYFSISKVSAISETFDNNYAKIFTTFGWVREALEQGSDSHLDEYTSKDKDVSKLDKLYDEALENQKEFEIYSNDKCAYRCAGTNKMTDEYYNICKERNTNYKECKKQISDFYDSCYNENCHCERILDSNGQKACLDACEKRTLECVEYKGNAFSYKEYKDAKDLAEKNYKDKVKEIETSITENRKKLFYVEADPLGIKWNFAPYEGRCEDVKFLHYVWNFITIGAPFLVIILGIVDYFKIVINTDSNAANKNKKNFTRRIIALILLILVPVIIKVILANLTPSGSTAGSVKLMQCIVNGK